MPMFRLDAVVSGHIMHPQGEITHYHSLVHVIIFITISIELSGAYIVDTPYGG